MPKKSEGTRIVTEDQSLSSLSEKIEDAMENSICGLQNLLQITQYKSSTHLTLIVSGWDSSCKSKQLIAQYLVGLRASAIDSALHIKASLLEDSAVGKVDLRGSISEIIGTSNADLSDVQKTDERNPWIAEAIWHLCMVLASRRPEIHPPGRIIAVKDVHVKAKDHGTDGMALYITEQDIGLSVIESKAYKNDPRRAIRRAAAYFREIENDKHTTRIRQDISVMRRSLSPERQALVKGVFWKQRRIFMPNPHYDDTKVMDWVQPLTPLEALSIDKASIVIMPHKIHDFDVFFDEISELMREFVGGL